MLWQVELTNSLEKIQCRPEKDWTVLKSLSALRGETVAFQIALKLDKAMFVRCDILPESDFPDSMHIRFAESVPCYMPTLPNDPTALATRPSLLPDPLIEQSKEPRVTRDNWHSFHVSIKIPRKMAPGIKTIRLRLAAYDYAYKKGPVPEDTYEIKVPVEVICADMPETQDLKFTNWLMVDSVIHQHNVQCWSDKLWKILENYFKNYSAHGSNLLFTPLWTPPMGVVEGKHRPICQLLIIKEKKGKYEFDFSRLKRWIDTARRAGIENFEMVHAFSQWGATACPTVMIEDENGNLTERFGWDMKATDPVYLDFLRQLMKKLLPFLRKEGLAGKCWFHISDEPFKEHMVNYKKASDAFCKLVEDFPVIDALSDIEIYHSGAIKCPVPMITQLEKFLKEDIPVRWVYYTGFTGHWPSRYIGIPLIRVRILALYLYYFNLNGGFLHWGYNGHSTCQAYSFDIDPWKETEWGRRSASGAGFLVYPGKDGPVDSIRHEVFLESVQDYRAFRLLERKKGRDFVLKLLEKSLPPGYKFSMRGYPINNEWYLNFRQSVNKELGRTK